MRLMSPTYAQTPKSETLGPTLVRIVLASITATLGQTLLWLLGGWAIDDLDRSHFILLLPALIAGLVVGIPTGLLMRHRHWTRLSNCMLAALLIGFVIAVAERASVLLGALTGRVAYPQIELFHPGQPDAFLWLLPEVLAWSVAGSLYWLVGFHHAHAGTRGDLPTRVSARTVSTYIWLCLPMAFVIRVLYVVIQKLIS